MRNNWLWFVDLDSGSPYVFSVEPVAFHGIGGHVFSHITSFVDNSFHQFRHFSAPGSLAVEGAFNNIAKLTGALALLFSGRFSLNMEITGNPNGSKVRRFRPFQQVRNISSSGQNFKNFRLGFRLSGESGMPVLFGKLSNFLSKFVYAESERLQSHSVLSLAAALVPPLDKLSSKVLAVPLENSHTDMMVQRTCEVHNGRSGLAFLDLDWKKLAIEPRTGIEFPMILDNILAGNYNSNLCSEVLVGTGSRTMKIIKIKSLKVYAFGFYVHPSSLCEKLGPKYASVSVDELNKRQDFYDDLLREDINMTVRLVVSCNGIKINTVRDAFEKSLRARLVKANPATDFHCIKAFGSCFTRDIPLPAGTTIDFRRTVDGQLITEIGGNQIGAVHSKDLCRAFFSMYIGDIPVSEQTKEDIGKNVGNMIRRC